MSDLVSTLGDVATPTRARRSLWVRRTGIALLALLVACAAFGLFDGERVVTRAAGDTTVTFTHPSTLRAGEAVRLSATIETQAPQVSLAVPDGLFTELGITNIWPPPIAQRGTSNEHVYEFEAPNGHITIVASGRLDPATGMGRQSVAFSIPETTIDYESTIWVLP